MKIEKELGLTCDQTRVLLPVISLRKSTTVMKPEELAAVRHYRNCLGCQEIGLARVIGQEVSCQEFVLAWGRAASALWLFQRPGFSLLDVWAVEHVWAADFVTGKGDVISPRACSKRPCRELFHYWNSIPMSSSCDGEEGTIYLFPKLFEIFWMEHWDLDDLLELQQNRISGLLDSIKEGSVTVYAPYHSVAEVIQEHREHVNVLQKLALCYQRGTSFI